MKMKKEDRIMSMLMGTTMSLCMSFIGNITSGHFTVPGFISSFIISFVICIVIGLFVPIGQVANSITDKCGLRRGSMGRRALESLITDIFFTPIMTVAMISYAYNMAKKHGDHMKFVPAFLSSLLIGLIICFLLAFILTPVYLKIARNGSNPPQDDDKKDEE